MSLSSIKKREKEMRDIITSHIVMKLFIKEGGRHIALPEMIVLGEGGGSNLDGRLGVAKVGERERGV